MGHGLSWRNQIAVKKGQSPGFTSVFEGTSSSVGVKRSVKEEYMQEGSSKSAASDAKAAVAPLEV